MAVAYVTHGKEWSAHKYLRKERLSNGEYRYYYPYNLPKNLKNDIGHQVYRRGEYYDVSEANQWTKSKRQIQYEIQDIIFQEMGKTIKSLVVDRDVSRAKNFISTVKGRVGDIEVEGGDIFVSRPIRITNGEVTGGAERASYSRSLRYVSKYNKYKQR